MADRTGLLQEVQILVDPGAGARPAIGQCDACSPIVSVRPSAPGAFRPGVAYRRAPDLLHRPLSSSGYHAVLGPGSRAPALLNDRALRLLDEFETPATVEDLSRKWAGTLDGDSIRSALDPFLSAGLLVPRDAARPGHVEGPHTLAAWLHVTNRCNLRCAYCYLSPSNEDMPAHVGAASVEATFRSALRHGYRRVKLKYAGGEPLLVLPAVVQMHERALELARRHELDLDGVVISNGTLLTAPAIETLRALDLSLTVSLDGLGRGHEAQRPYAGGRDSAPDVLRGIERAMAMGLKPAISITVSPRNVGGLPDLLGWILERDLPFGLNFYRENDRSAATTALRLDRASIVEGLLRAYRVIEARMSPHSLWSTLADRLDLSAPHLRACSVGQGYLVFSPAGRLSKCQMDMAHTVGDVHDADPLAAVRRSPSGILNLPVHQVSECQACRWRYWCAGGCPLMAYRATGRFDSKSPNCEIYRALLPEVLRLEGVRLLKRVRSHTAAQEPI